MKNIRNISVIVLSVIIMAMTSVTAFAAELNFNGTTAQVGDTVTYTLNLADVPAPVAGIQMSVCYDSDYFELNTDSVTCNGFPGYLANTNVKGEVIMTATEGVEGYDFTKKNEIISLSFKVLKEGSTDITYYIYDLYDIYEYGPGDYLKTYTLTCDIKVNGNSSVTDATPSLNADKNTSTGSGDFVNNESGQGEISIEEATVPETDSTVETNSVTDPSVMDLPDITDGNDSNALSESNNTAVIITVIAVIAVILIAAAAAFIIIKRKKKPENSK